MGRLVALQFLILQRAVDMLAVALSLLLCVTAMALEPALLPSQHVRRTWTIDHGLPENSVGAVARSGEGYLWIGTTSGLARFNGTEFVSFTRAKTPALVSDEVWALACTRDGSVWIGTKDGLVRHEATGTFRRWGVSDGLPAAHVTCIAEDDQSRVWFGTKGGGIGVVEGQQLTSLGLKSGLTNLNIWGLLPENNGSLWIATVDGLFVLRDGHFQRFGKEAGFPTTFITSLARDANGSLWVGTLSGLCEFRGGRVVRVIGASEGIKDPRVFRIAVDPDGTVWAATIQGGLAKITPQGVAMLDESTGLQSNSLRSVFVDAEENLWLGTSAGLVQMRQGFITPWSSTEGVPVGPFALTLDHNENVLVGTPDGLFMKQEARFTRLMPDLIPGRVEALLVARDGAIWTGGNNTVRRVQGDTSKAFELPRPPDRADRPNVFGTMHQSPDGSVWIGAASGLFRYDPEANSEPLVFGTSDGLPMSHVLSLASTPDGALWIGTTEGLARLEASKIDSFGLKDGLPNLQIQCLLADPSGVLWIGTERGLVRKQGGTFTVWGLSDGLPNDQIRGIAAKEGWLWLCTPKGLVRVAIADLNAPRGTDSGRIPIRVFSALDGLPGHGCGASFYTPASIVSPDGSIWMIANNGLAQVRPDAVVTDRPGPPISITSIHADGEPRALSSEVHLGASTRRVEIAMSAIELVKPGTVEYRYRIDGVDTDWSEVGTNGLITFRDLPAGILNLRAQARSAAGDWSVAEARLSINKDAALYQRWWFMCIVGTTVAALAWAVHRSGLSKQRRQLEAVQHAVAEERSRLAGDIHDSLAQSFAGIAMQLEAAEDAALSGDKLASAVGIGKAREIARFGLSEARRSVMSLRPEHTLGSGLVPALLMLADRTTVRGLLTCAVVSSASSIEIPYQPSLSILQTAQEAISNAIRHGQPTLINITVTEHDGDVVLTVEDNGKGLPATGNMLREGTGIPGMRQRAASFNGTFVIEQRSGGGVRVQAVYRRLKESGQ
jgi:ligand-binding sensor domain-containing protein/signal transduction histidine kinase